MRETVCYMVVQVVSRHPSGNLKEWYDGDQLATMEDAKLELDKMCKLYQATEFRIIRRSIQEIGRERMGA